MRVFWRILMALLAAGGTGVAVGIASVSASTRLALLALAAALLVALARVLSLHITRPLDRVRRLALRLAQGEGGSRTHERASGEIGELAAAVDVLADRLDSEIAPLRFEQAQATEILGAMSDGVLLLDGGGRVLRANAAAARMVGVSADELRDRSIVHAARAFPGVTLVEQALRADGPSESHIEMPGARFLHVQMIPLEEEASSQSGPRPTARLVLLILRDETDRMRLDRTRRDFVANVSHELKTPLAGITLLADTLQHAIEEDPEAARRFADRLVNEVSSLSNLVTDLLTLSRLEERVSNRADGVESADLGEIVRSVASDLSERARATGVTLAVEAPTEAPVVGNPVDLESLVRNLLDNAVRFTDPGGHVVVGVQVLAGEAVLTVRDDGVGIPRDDQDRIFERFYRVDRARSRETGGTGLGLSIVRHVAEGLGGRVTVESAVGVGSTFTVRLPTTAGPPTARQT